MVEKLELLNSFQEGSKVGSSALLVESFTYRYLKGIPQLTRMTRAGGQAITTDIDIRILSDAIVEAYRSGQSHAVEYLKHFKGLVDYDFSRMVVSSHERSDHKTELVSNPIDSLIFEVEETDSFPASTKNVYFSAFQDQGIGLPFGKKSMDELLVLLKYKKTVGQIETLDDLKRFSFEFFSTTWPLFSPTVLEIVSSYFGTRKGISLEKLEADWHLLGSFGFERLHSRLILLQAVNGSRTAKMFVERSDFWSATGLEDGFKEKVGNYLSGFPSGFTDLGDLSAGNPIENAIFLSIYVYERTDPYNFIDRLLIVCEIDPTIAQILDWDILYADVWDVRTAISPKAVFLAAVLRTPSVMSSSRTVASQYGRGGAGSDLTRFAKSVAKQGGNRATFLNSFDELPKGAFRQVMDFLFSSSILDRIANVFPSNTSESVFAGSSSAMRSLETRDDLIRYAKRRKILTPSHAAFLLKDLREKYRQIRYEDS